MKAPIVLIALVALGCAHGVDAESLGVVIDPLDAAAESCGVSEAQLEGVARRTIAASQWQPLADAAARLSVGVKMIASRRDACAGRITVRMRAAEFPPPADAVATAQRGARAPVLVLCSKSGNASAPKASFASAVESAVEYWARQCLRSLNR